MSCTFCTFSVSRKWKGCTECAFQGVKQGCYKTFVRPKPFTVCERYKPKDSSWIFSNAARFLDIAKPITGKNDNDTAQALRRLQDRFPEVKAKRLNFKFAGRRQRKAPVGDMYVVVQVMRRNAPEMISEHPVN